MHPIEMNRQLKRDYQRRGWIPGTFCSRCGCEVALPEQEYENTICSECSAPYILYEGKLWLISAYIRESGDVVLL